MLDNATTNHQYARRIALVRAATRIRRRHRLHRRPEVQSKCSCVFATRENSCSSASIRKRLRAPSSARASSLARHQAFLRFLRHLDREFPRICDLHPIVDNSCTYSHANVNAWLFEHPRFHLHFIPTSSSWLNLVKRWFRNLEDKAIRRSVFHSVPDLITAIEDFLDRKSVV